MKLILLYGLGEVAKRDALLKVKAKFPTDAVFTIDLKQAGDKELSDLLSSSPLFVTERLVVAENAPTNLDISKFPQSDGLTVVLVAGTLQTNSILLKAAKEAKAQIATFEADKEVNAFNYLDALIEGRKQVAFMELDKLLKEHGGIYVLSMIYYLLRRNLLPMPKSEFMAKKVTGQKNHLLSRHPERAQRVEGSIWSELYKKTLETEYKIKSGLIDDVTALTTLTQNFI